MCSLVLASKTVSPGISLAPKETPLLQECSEPDFPPDTMCTNTWLDLEAKVKVGLETLAPFSGPSFKWVVGVCLWGERG